MTKGIFWETPFWLGVLKFMEEYELYIRAVKIIGAPVLVVLVLDVISRDNNSKEGGHFNKFLYFLVLLAPIVIAILTVPYVEKLNSI